MSAKRKSKRDPKYQRVVSALRDQIRTLDVGKLSESGLMEQFGVGRNTVLKALDMLEAEGLVRRVKGSGTFPVRDPRVPLKHVNIVFTDGMLGNLRHGGMPSFLLFSRLQGVFHYRQIGQCFVKIIFFRLEESLLVKTEKILSLGPRSGLVIPAYRGFEDIIEVCRAHHVPYITSSPSGMDFNAISTDYYGGSVKAVTHLVKHSDRKNILFVAASLESPWLRPRHDGYAAALKSCGIPLREELVLLVDPDDPSVGKQLASALRAHPEIDAIFATSGRFWPALSGVLRELEVKIPAERAVVVFDDPPELVRHDPPISAVRTPLEQMGTVMVEKVAEMIDFGFRDDHRIKLDCELVIRGSS